MRTQTQNRKTSPQKKSPSKGKVSRSQKASQRTQKTKKQSVAKGTKARHISKTERKSAASNSEAMPTFIKNKNLSRTLLASTSQFKNQAQVQRSAIRAQKTNWPSAASRTEGKLESKRNPSVRRNKRSGKR